MYKPQDFAKLFQFEPGQLLAIRNSEETDDGEEKNEIRQIIQFDGLQFEMNIGFPNEDALDRAFEKYNEESAKGMYDHAVKFVNQYS